jgi:cytochrome c peroxidase
MKAKRLIGFILCVGLLSFYSVRDPLFKNPKSFPEPVYPFHLNPLKKEKIQLGRILFYDPILSKDQSISCESCHSPYNAFAHTDHSLSHGIHDSIGTRNAPGLFNLAWQTSFMWDGAINHLDMQALAPISHPNEMGETLTHVIDKLNQKFYPALFKSAFGDSLITGERILKSLSQFLLTLTSNNAKYDRVKEGKASFTKQEQNGYMLFKKNCGVCHTEPLFSSYSFANNGLPLDNELNDYGKGALTFKPEDSFQFKIPSLRNLSYTYPYMHDGRFKKLYEVLNHYTDGITKSPNLSKHLQKPMVLSSHEKVDLLSFLLTLNDSDFVFNKKNTYPPYLKNKNEGFTK